jgi:sugar phosphate isomerase/epimerase
VKEQVYQPDWMDPQRLDYTKRLFDLLAALVPLEVEGSVSTLPGSFKVFITTQEQERAIRDNLWSCVEHIAKVSECAGRRLRLGVEPEPLGWFENSAETVKFFEQLRDEHPGDARLDTHLGVNYDTCHFAVEYEEPATAIERFQRHGIRLCKIHLSDALKLRPSTVALKQLAPFADSIYLHQVIIRRADGSLTRFCDLGPALSSVRTASLEPRDEWRVHFHVPLHSELTGELNTTEDHVLGLLEFLQAQPQLCAHLEIETYTWAVLPEPLRSRDVTDQVVAEYDWTLLQLRAHGLA